MEFHEWLKIGIDNSWCGPAVCETHDGIPMSEEEESLFYDEGLDPCIHIIRLYESVPHRMEIELNHSPSQWRNVYYSREDRDRDYNS